MATLTISWWSFGCCLIWPGAYNIINMFIAFILHDNFHSEFVEHKTTSYFFMYLFFFHCIFSVRNFIHFLNSNTCIIVLLCWLHFVNLFVVLLQRIRLFVWQWCERIVQHRMPIVQYNCNVMFLFHLLNFY